MRRVTFARVRLGSAQNTDERTLNEFLREVKIRKIIPALVQNAIPNFWSVYIEYDEDEERLTSNEDAFQGEEVEMYEALRQWRNRTAAEKGLLPYQIFHNAHLKQMVKNNVTTIEEIAVIRGVGTSRASAYGPFVLELLARSTKEG